jgi:hypothetical protein
LDGVADLDQVALTNPLLRQGGRRAKKRFLPFQRILV